MANMQMPREFFSDVYSLLANLHDEDISPKTRELCRKIAMQLKTKVEAVERRNSFTAYKQAESGAARESKRVEYLDKAGVHKSWRTSTEHRQNN